MPEIGSDAEAQTMATTTGGWRFDHSYSRLPPILFKSVAPTKVKKPGLLIFNHQLAEEFGLQAELSETPEIFAGNGLPEGALPLAQAYAGHQFGHFTMLGDGRAILLGEHIGPAGRRFDIQLKGPGRTPYSRGGDGRAVVGPMLREYLISEAMFALGIPTTRSLAVATTGEKVHRERPLPGAVLTRVAASHLRVGTFEFVASLGNNELLRTLADYTLARHFPAAGKTEEPYRALLEEVVKSQASLIASWLLVGFVHGVMNTDNMALSGETIDYGPCAFLDVYYPETVFSSIDRQGRYAFAHQPRIAQWNLSRFAECLLPLLHENEEKAITIAQETVDAFVPRFQQSWLEGMRRKLGLLEAEDDDPRLIGDLLTKMHERRSDFTNTFRDLTAAQLPGDDPAFEPFFEAWKARLEKQATPMAKALEVMQANNPAVIPRNHQVEVALKAAEAGDLAPTNRLLAAFAAPYDHQRDHGDLHEPSPPDSPPYRTFCGT